ncbi:MAG TPA: AMP-dependent synthetase [Bacteroidales bacterium]|nr:AMP-dependent synthetase [Bacteroidales bacterium]
MNKLKNQTLPSLLKNSVELYANNTALSYVNEESLTYTELNSEIEKIKKLLVSQGVKKEDKVAILSRNMPNWGIAFFAITSLGAIAVPLLPDFHENEIKNILEHSEAKCIFVSKLMYPKIENLPDNLLKTIIYSDDFEIRRGKPKSVNSDYINEVNVEESDLASIIYTSGTTGKSKGVMLTHKNIVFDAIQVLSIENVQSHHRFLSILPLSHTYENTLGLVLPILQGAAVYYLEKPPTPSALVPAMKKVKPTHILSVPMVIEKIYRNQVLPKFTKSKILSLLYKISPIRKTLNKLAGNKLKETFGGELVFFGIGGAALDPTVEKFLREAKFPYAIGYGLTESAPLLSGANPQVVKFRGTGPIMQGIEVKINNPDPVTGEGEVWAKGDNIMKGYYKEPELTKEVLTPDGWLKTGDRGYFDKDNYLFLKGRIKNMIVGSSGENIYPEEIESVINNFKYVLESIVVEQKGKLVALVHFNYEELEKQFHHLKDEAVAFAKKKTEELMIELQEHVNSRVNKFSRIYAVIPQITPFEKTATQKIKRYLYC